jgi:hypothetical protein
VLATRHERFAAGVLDDLDDPRDVFVARVRTHHHDHGLLLIAFASLEAKPPGIRPGASSFRRL